jgi:hypothetical protein
MLSPAREAREAEAEVAARREIRGDRSEKRRLWRLFFFGEPPPTSEKITAAQEDDAILVIIVNFRSWHA